MTIAQIESDNLTNDDDDYNHRYSREILKKRHTHIYIVCCFFLSPSFCKNHSQFKTMVKIKWKRRRHTHLYTVKKKDNRSRAIIKYKRWLRFPFLFLETGESIFLNCVFVPRYKTMFFFFVLWFHEQFTIVFNGFDGYGLKALISETKTKKKDRRKLIYQSFVPYTPNKMNGI